MNRMKLTTDRMRSSSREESIASEVDDLTVIAEFDYPSDEDPIPSYHITSPYEIVGLSLTNGLRNGGRFHDFGYDQTDAERGTIRKDIYDDSRDYAKFNDFSREKFRKDNSKSLGIQATAIYNSRATSPLTATELINLDLTSQESLFNPETILEDKSTNTEDKIKAASRNVTTSTDYHDSQFWEQVYKDKPILKASGTQTVRAINNAAVQVVLDKDYEDRRIKDLESAQLETRQWQNLSEVVQIENDKLNDTIDKMETEIKDLRSSLTESKRDKNLSEEIQLENNKLKKMIDDMKTEIKDLRSSSMESKRDKNLSEEIQMENNKLKKMIDNMKAEIKDLRSSLMESKRDKNISEEIQLENNELKKLIDDMNDEIKDLRSSLMESKRDKNLSEEIKLENNELKKLIDDMSSEISILRSHPEKIRTLEGEKNKADKTLAEMENRIKNVLNDSEDDLKFVRSKLEKAMRDLDERDVQIKDMAAQMKDHKTRQSNLERVIEDLKLHLKNANIQYATKYNEVDFSDGKQNLNLLNNSNEDYGDLLRKYNNLRKIASKLQASISPLKAKLGLTNKKCRLKDELLRRLIDHTDTEIPTHLKIEVEENLRDNDHYRPLSPLTLSHIDRLEHDLIDNLYEKIPFFGHVDENKKSSSADIVDGDFLKDLIYDVPKSETSTERIKKTMPVKDDLFRDIGRTQMKTSQSLHGSIQSKSKRQNENILAGDRPKMSDLPTRTFSRTLPRDLIGRHSHINVVPPPQNFRIEDILDAKRFLFSWEPPQTSHSSIVGYELLVNNSKKDFIPGAMTSKHTLNFVTNQVFPVTFELSSVRSDGNLSTPARIVVHGLQKINSNKDSVASKLGLRSKALSEKSLNINENKNMYVAFYDYIPSGFIYTKDGVAYSELGFKTGNIIETFGDALPNGYIFGKVSGNPQMGLIPLSFLEKIPR